jgi:hypothetical protein
MLLNKLWTFLRGWRQELRARVSKFLVTRQVIKVLSLTHAQELAITPRNEWALVRSKQVEEIQAVRSGQTFDIVDRRSWSYPYLPEALHRLNQPILKNTPYNLRRFSETPIPRRAMNLVKNSVLSFRWVIKPTKEFVDDIDPDREQRIRIASETFKRPNETGESSRDLLEMMLEDFLLNGAGCAEQRTTPYFKRPTKLWAVDSSTIRIFLDWTESTPDRPRYAQMTGLKGERGIVSFLNGELFYIRDNIRTATPFGLGRLEVAFNSVNAFLGVQDMASKAGADQVHKTWLWWEQTLNPAHIQTIRRHIINELEGQAKISLVAGAKAPQVIDVNPVVPQDLLLDWQKFLIQIIAAAFDLSPQALNMDDHPAKATAQVMADSDWKSGVVPVATRFQEAITRQWIHDVLKWRDLEFEFVDLDEPDKITRTVIHQRWYAMNAITPNEIRKTNNMPPLPGPFGKLTAAQTQMIMMLMQAKIAASMGQQGGGGMSSGGGQQMVWKPPSSGGTAGAGGSGLGATLMGSGMNADDVSQMDPQMIQMYQDLGLLPPTQQLGQQMDQQSPGIMEQLSDELTQFFEDAKMKQEADEITPAPVTPLEERQQQEKFFEDQHQESLAEKVINRRGTMGPSVTDETRKNPERGKYPRSGGTYLPTGRAEDEGKLPKPHYRPGRNNPYNR